MRDGRALLLCISVFVAAAPAGAEEQALDRWRVQGAAGVATENVGRGISYSMEKVAPFANFVARRGAFEAAGSAVRVAGPADVELAGAVRAVMAIKKVELRAQVEYTAYPGADPNIDYWEFGLTARRSFKRGFVQLGARESPDDSGGAQYLFVDVGRKLATTPLGDLSARGRFGFRPYDDNARAGLPDYRHWLVATELRRGPIGLEIAYHDTSLPPGTFFPAGPRVVARLTAYFGS
jgi:hypothetical protein